MTLHTGIPIDERVAYRTANVGAVRLHVAEMGEGLPVILLHGFPDFWYSWRNQMPALAAAGYRAIAPDLRGYNLSDKPRSVRDYRVGTLAADIEALVDWAGVDRAPVIGHDWGAAVAWQLAMQAPDRVERLAILNVPHPVSLLHGLRSPRQILRSSYIGFFQVPRLPEAVLAAGHHFILRQVFRRDPANPSAFTPADIERYVATWSRPGALTGGINYYRALRYDMNQVRSPMARIDAPTLVIWGEKDRYLGKDLADPPADLVPNARVERLPNASHWVQMDEPDTVNRLLIEFLRS